ncbi:shikimate 5-dehydrogenase [Thioploca ingrica]|uniref:Shikimate dehydrogenase (NADP(+)) n=1 Tax=Thioploca ingrica TaxID=40754 RepID=A0A090AE96_9GAMM|nr:shikimate 5-dehydrogenase [Thioploca ingrica]
MTDSQPTLDRYAVMGNPIAHSKSPFIHTQFAQQTGQAMQYEARLVSTQAGEFAKAVAAFQSAGGKGLNITIPFKQDAWRLADKRSQRAERAGAVNTLWFDERGQRLGDNTDGIGLVRDLINNHGGQIAGKRVLILGAGGAVHGVLETLLQAKPIQCVIANRTVSKAEILATSFNHFGQIIASTYASLAGQSFDLIINGTSASLHGQLPPLPAGLIMPDTWCYDMMYARTPTPFMQWAQSQGALQVLDGLGMLVEQAAESFYLWRGLKPNTAAVIQSVQQQLLNDNQPQSTTSPQTPIEIGGPPGLEPTRYGDWERKGRCIDF